MKKIFDMRAHGRRLDDLVKLRDKLRLAAEYRTHNRLDFMDWVRYPRQNEMRVAILERAETKLGPNWFIVFGSNRSGKSELGGGTISEIFGRGQKLRIWCATLSDLSVKVQQRKLASMIRKSDIKYGEYNEVRGWKNRVIVSNNDSVIYIKTYEQGAAAFQGDDIDVVWLDEEPPWDVFSEIVIRLADRKGILIATFTSLQGFTRLVNRVWQATDPNIKTCVLTARENPFLTDEAKKQLYESIDPDERASRWDGHPHIKQGLIYKSYNSDDHRIKRFDYESLVKHSPERWELHEGIDPHERTPHHWIRFLYDRVNDVVYIVEELKAPTESMLIRDYSILIKGKRGKLRPVFTQIDTSSMKPDVITRHPDEDQDNTHTVRLEFLRCGIETILVTKDNAIGIDAVKSRLKVVRLPDGTVKKKPSLYVFDDLIGVHWEFTRYSWDSFASDKIAERREIVNRPLKKDDHIMDIIKYECIKLKTEKDRDDSPVEAAPELFDGTGY